MTSEDLQAIRERADKATKGEWRTLSGVNENEEHTIYVVAGDYVDEGEPDMIIEISESEDAVADAEFIAHAREDVPTLLDEIETLQTKVSIRNDVVLELKREIGQLRAALNRIAWELPSAGHAIGIARKALGLAGDSHDN